MEMLNNIWIALSTENVELVDFMLIILGFIESFLILMLFVNLLNIKCSRKQKILYIILSSLCTLMNKWQNLGSFIFIFSYLLQFLLIYQIFKQGFIKTLIALFVPSLIFALVTLLIVKVFTDFLNISFAQAESIPIYRLLYLSIVYATVGFIAFILKYKNLKIKILEDFDNKTKFVVITNFILGFTAVSIQAFIIIYYLNVVSSIIMFLNFIISLVYFGISLYTLNKITKLTLTTRELETSEAYNKSITVLYDNVKGFKHDFDNIVSAIGGYVETNDMEGLKEYYHSLRDDCQKSNNIATLNPNIINNPAIYSILSSKYHKADNLGIKINLEFFVDLNTFEIKPYEFSRILGILLDNAIEAANECEEKLINIQFRNEYNRNRNIIVISNTYKDKYVDTETIFEKGKSGKANHSGLGLWEVRQYIKKNNNLNLYTTKDTKYFTQQLEIYNNKK